MEFSYTKASISTSDTPIFSNVFRVMPSLNNERRKGLKWRSSHGSHENDCTLFRTSVSIILSIYGLVIVIDSQLFLNKTPSLGLPLSQIYTWWSITLKINNP